MGGCNAHAPLASAARKETIGPTAMGGRSSGRPIDLMWPIRSGSLRGPEMLPRYSKSRIPSGRSQSRPASLPVMPDDRKSCIPHES